MIVDLLDGDAANISFSNSVKVSIGGDSGHSYTVTWYKKILINSENNAFDFQMIGQMDLRTGTWGKYDFDEIGQWKIEFHKDNQYVAEYFNDLKDKNIIIIAKTKPEKAGKNLNFEFIKNYCSSLVNVFGCNLKVYFPDSSRYDFSGLNFQPLRLNDDIEEMHFGIEKEF